MTRRGGGRSAAIDWIVIDKVKGEFMGSGIGFHGDYYVILVVMVRKMIGHVVRRRWGGADAVGVI
jgi:hypothetical protein